MTNIKYQMTNGKWKAMGTGEETPRRPDVLSVSRNSISQSLKSRAAPASPRLRPYTAALPDASGGSFQSSKLPNISNTRKPTPRLTNSLRCATSGKSESSPADPSPAFARNSWRDPETSSPPESSRAARITSFQSLPTHAAGKSARNLQLNSSRKNRVERTSHQDSA